MDHRKVIMLTNPKHYLIREVGEEGRKGKHLQKGIRSAPAHRSVNERVIRMLAVGGRVTRDTAAQAIRAKKSINNRKKKQEIRSKKAKNKRAPPKPRNRKVEEQSRGGSEENSEEEENNSDNDQSTDKYQSTGSDQSPDDADLISEGSANSWGD